MRCTLVFTLLAAVSSVVAAPISSVVARYAPLADAAGPSLVKRVCNPMPSKVDPKMRDFIYKHVRSKTRDPKILEITMCTAITESLVNNLNCGDQDSVGLYQQRPSKGWGSVSQIMDPAYSTDKFLEALMPIYRKNPGLPVNVLAQMVQLAEAGDWYKNNIQMAKQLIREAAASVGDSEDDNAGDDKPAPAPAPPATGGAINVGGNPNKDDDKTPAQAPPATGDEHDDEDCDDSLPPCETYYTPVSGDICSEVANKFGLDLKTFYSLNPEIDANCQNLYAGKEYCVAAADV